MNLLQSFITIQNNNYVGQYFIWLHYKLYVVISTNSPLTYWFTIKGSSQILFAQI